jgi:phospholipase C
MNSIESDIRTLCQDFYIGKFGNSYSNRCLLTSAISSYLDAYLSEGIIESAEVGFDLEAIKAAMKKANKSYDDMSDEEILQCDFGTGVYIAITLSLRDAIEDITVNITI